MTAQVCKSDIIIAIHPRHIANIVSRVKNHEFRKHLLPVEVSRLWIYETSPASSVKYVATISPSKRPGEIHDPSGLRNDEFDQGKLEHLVKYAYEIRRLEALAAPVSLSDLKQNGWLNGPPQKYCYVKQAMRQALSVMSTNLLFDSTTSVPVDCTGSSGAHPDPKPERSQSSP
jgi:predicted transcriptional regulator